MAKYDVTFDYFHGYESEQFAFYRIPKVLFTDDYFRNLSSDAKVLYGLMLDRMALSMKNRWIDEENRVYIIFSLEQVMMYMNCGRDKGMKTLAELDTKKGIGLIERVKQGFGKPDVIYVKSFVMKEKPEPVPEPDPTPDPTAPADRQAAIDAANAYAVAQYGVTTDSSLTLDNSAYRFPAAVPVDASQETLEAKARDMVDFTFHQLMMQAGRDSVADAGFRCNVCIVEDGDSLLIYVLYDG